MFADNLSLDDHTAGLLQQSMPAKVDGVTTRYVVRGTGAIPFLEFVLEAALWCAL
ncbi:hypothetical protein [Cryobacterium sp. AP23]